ncbi:MAG TPA: methyltransferase [Candidatus Sulfotelmatobacter sp.]|nr:methyltransferase [Candidatus Sulfotelmatobacter sp.]
MTYQAASATTPFQLLKVRDGLILHQALYAAAKLGVADLLQDGPCTTAELAHRLGANESALHRVLRALASQGIFEETSPSTFANNALSSYLRTGVPGSVRSMVIFWGTETYYRPFGEILYSIQTGHSARAKVFEMDGWEYLQRHPEMARIFDDAMTDMSALVGPAVASAYDFGRWGSIMDVGGGNGILLAAILKAYPGLRGVLADLPHVLERAQQRGFLRGELEARSATWPCDFFREVPSGCRAYVMKQVIHDWDDEHAQAILANCRRAVPADGVLLLVELAMSEGNLPSAGQLGDVVMLVMTGGKERTTEEYRQLLTRAGFRLSQVVPASPGLNIIEALPD